MGVLYTLYSSLETAWLTTDSLAQVICTQKKKTLLLYQNSKLTFKYVSWQTAMGAWIYLKRTHATIHSQSSVSFLYELSVISPTEIGIDDQKKAVLHYGQKGILCLFNWNCI